MRQIVLGSRGSELARAQTDLVQRALQSAQPDLQISVRIIQTSGDEGSKLRTPDKTAGRKGLFTAEIERALLRREVDMAVHSAKDLPSEVASSTEICAVLARASAHDVLVSKKPLKIVSLPQSGTVATGSIRRVHQLRWKRPDLQIADLRGNVPTRLRKLQTNNWDGIILASAGLERLGFDLSGDKFSFEEVQLFFEPLVSAEFVPAGGQGIIAVQIRGEDEDLKQISRKINHRDTFRALRAEREFLRLLHGDCDSPVGVFASVAGDHMTARAQFFERAGEPPKSAEIVGSLAETTPEKIAGRLYILLHEGK